MKFSVSFSCGLLILGLLAYYGMLSESRATMHPLDDLRNEIIQETLTPHPPLQAALRDPAFRRGIRQALLQAPLPSVVCQEFRQRMVAGLERFPQRLHTELELTVHLAVLKAIQMAIDADFDYTSQEHRQTWEAITTCRPEENHIRVAGARSAYVAEVAMDVYMRNRARREGQGLAVD